MNNNLNLVKIIKKVVFPALVVAILLCFPAAAFANGAKMFEYPEGQGSFYFDENSNIALLEETVSFSEIEAKGSDPKAKVTVEYSVKNLLDEERNIKMFFVIPPTENFKVVMDNKDITRSSTYKEIPLPENWLPKFTTRLVEPISKKELFESNANGHLEKANGLEIPLIFSKKGLSHIKIEYVCRGGFYNREKVHTAVYGYVYFLTPAKFWEGEPKVNLNVSLPDTGNYSFYSSIPMQKTSKNTYSAVLSKLPDSEWSFSFTDKSKLIFGTNSTKTHSMLTLLSGFVLFGSLLIASIRFRKRYLRFVGYVLSVGFIFAVLGKVVDGYVGDLLIYALLILVFFILIPVFYLIFRFTTRKHG